MNDMKYKLPKTCLFLLEDLNINKFEVAKIAGFSPFVYDEDEIWITGEEMFAFWDACVELHPSSYMALEAAKFMKAEYFDPAIFACFCSRDYNTAMTRLSSYKRLVAPIELHVDITEKGTSLKTNSTIERQISYFVKIMELVFFTKIIRMATRQEIKPLKVVFSEAKEDLIPYNEFFGVEVEIGEEFEIVFSKEDSEIAFITENSLVWDAFEKDLNRKLINSGRKLKTQERVKSILLEILPTGISHIDEVASRLAMSKRTLQRRLKDERMVYQEVLDDTREGLATHYLSKTDITISEISFLLGYKDQNSFYRAFKKWKNKSPIEFKKQLIS